SAVRRAKTWVSRPNHTAQGTPPPPVCLAGWLAGMDGGKNTVMMAKDHSDDGRREASLVRAGKGRHRPSNQSVRPASSPFSRWIAKSQRGTPIDRTLPRDSVVPRTGG